jgi:hypothetical protein
MAVSAPTVNDMDDMDDRTSSVTTFFDRYARALSAIDLDRLADCYHYPSLAVSRLGCLAITDPEQTRQFFAANGPRYHQRGIRSVRIVPRPASYHKDGLWVGLADLENIDADGNLVDVEHNAYQLVRDDTSWRIAVTTPLDAR